MARLEHIRFIPHRCQVADGEVVYAPLRHGHVIEYLPQIFWQDQTPWQEANLWAAERAMTRDVSINTVEANLRGLADYAEFLESAELLWFTFPERKADRCLVQYREYLVKARDDGKISPSTATQRMRHAIAFYRWVLGKGFFTPQSPLWRDIPVYIKYFDSVGFERTMLRITTDVSISNRSRPGERLEDSLLPVSPKDRDAILVFARDNASEELFLFLSCGFFTGMRLGTLCDLKIQTLEQAVPDPASRNLFRLAIGPGASPPVHTKFGVTGQIWITQQLLDSLREYAYSPRRLMREAKAAPEHRNLLFLTRFGNPYGRRGSDQSSALNVEMSSFRKAGVKHGLPVLHKFHFHQTRCTFGTELARLAIAAGGAINAIAIVREAMIHKDEATSFRYIKFVEKTPIKEDAANAFTEAFLGVMKGVRTRSNA